MERIAQFMVSGSYPATGEADFWFWRHLFITVYLTPTSATIEWQKGLWWLHYEPGILLSSEK